MNKYKITSILKSFLLIWTVGALSGCASGPSSSYAPSPEQIESAHYGESPKLYKETIEAVVKGDLIDPESARFTNYSKPKKDWLSEFVGFGAEKYFGWLVCVDVNAKNRYGGYVGKKPYFFLFQNEKVVFFQTQTTKKIAYGAWKYPIECEY